MAIPYFTIGAGIGAVMATRHIGRGYSTKHLARVAAEDVVSCTVAWPVIVADIGVRTVQSAKQRLDEMRADNSEMERAREHVAAVMSKVARNSPQNK